MTVIYSPATWPEFVSDPRRPALLDWLRANSIDPNDLPEDQTITIQDNGSPHPLIVHTAYVRDEHGRIRAEGDQLVTEARAVPLTVEPPEAMTAP